MTRQLTALSIEKASVSEARREIPDGNVRGLYLVVQPSGLKSFALRYRFNGKSRKYTIGPYPDIDLKIARQLALQAKTEIALKRDPATIRQEEKRNAITNRYEDVVDLYIEKYAKARLKKWRQTGMSMNNIDYHAYRRRYQPDDLRLVIIAESPPASGDYIYNPTSPRDPLFVALMKQLECRPASKEEGLQQLKYRGLLLVDATYTPVDKLGNPNSIILAAYPTLKADLESIMADRRIPVVLVKKNVCELLDRKLVADGFDVLNNGKIICFPSHGNQPKFHLVFGEIMRSRALALVGSTEP